MASIAVAATNTLLKLGDGGGPESFTTIASVKDITGPGFTTDIVDVTSHDSSGYHEKLPTLKDAGQLTFVLNFNNHATQGFTTGLYNDWVNRTLRNFQLVIPTTVNKTASFSAYVTSFSLNMPVADALTADLTLDISGGVTWA